MSNALALVESNQTGASGGPGLIYQAIPKVMAAVGAIEKTRKNQQQNYNFRGIDDVFAAFQRPLAEAGIFYVPEVLDEQREERPTKSGGAMFYTRLRVAYTFYASDGSSVRAVVQGEAMDSGDKSSNKALSAALKYALLQIFCVPTEQEDADSDSPEVLPQQSKQAVQRPRPTEPAKPVRAAAEPQATAERQRLIREERIEIVKAVAKQVGLKTQRDLCTFLAAELEVEYSSKDQLIPWLHGLGADGLRMAIEKLNALAQQPAEPEEGAPNADELFDR